MRMNWAVVQRLHVSESHVGRLHSGASELRCLLTSSSPEPKVKLLDASFSAHRSNRRGRPTISRLGLERHLPCAKVPRPRSYALTTSAVYGWHLGKRLARIGWQPDLFGRGCVPVVGTRPAG